MKKALLITDMLVDFIRPDGGLYVPGAETIVPAVRSELDRARAAGDLVVFCCDSHDPDDLEFQRYPPHAVTGTPGAGIIEELAPLPGEAILPKKRLSSFYGTGLEDLLRQNRITHATVVGVVTHICVMEAVAGLCDRDITSRVPLAAVADFDPEMERAAIKRMASVFGALIEPLQNLD